MTPERRAQVEEEKRFLLASLVDLEREHAAGDVDDHDYSALKDSYTARAARLIAELEAAPAARASRGRSLLWVAVVIVLAALSGVLVARTSGERGAGQTMTGSVGDGSVSSLLTQARSMGMSDIPTVLDLYSRVLAVEPDNIEALTYFGWFSVLSATQESDEEVAAKRLQSGLVLLRQATITDASYPDAHCFLGIVSFRFANDVTTAKTELAKCQAADPPAQVKSFVDAVVAELDDAG